MKFQIITIFPEIFDSYFSESIIKRAKEKKLVEIKIHNLRNWTYDKHKTVDDSPYGGGAGMLMKAEPLIESIASIKQATRRKLSQAGGQGKRKTILFSAAGKTWSQELAKKYSKLDELIMVCGRYEGVDARIKKFVDEEISIGDYVLTGGEIPAMVVADSIIRLLPGALGNEESSKDESHSLPGVMEYPQYTRPEVLEIDGKKYRVPRVLLSGSHKEIEKWRESQRKQKTDSR